jgi:hypothetical protein
MKVLQINTFMKPEKDAAHPAPAILGDIPLKAPADPLYIF